MTSQRNSVFVGLCLLALVLGGCLSVGEGDSLNSSESPEDISSSPPAKPSDRPPAEEPKADKSTGSIAGQVASEDYESIPGASVRLYNLTGTVANVTTDGSGKFTINGVVPGRYNIEFNAECCRENIQSVIVKAGEVSSVSSVLEIWRSNREPYVVKDEWKGFLSYSGWLLIPWQSPDPNHRGSHEFEVQQGIDSLVVAIAWDEENGFNLHDCLYFDVLEVGEFNNGLYRDMLCHDNPIEFRLDAGEMWRYNHEGTDFDNMTDWPLTIRISVTAQEHTFHDSLIPNQAFQMPFTIYWQEHYWEHAPDDESALPTGG